MWFLSIAGRLHRHGTPRPHWGVCFSHLSSHFFSNLLLPPHSFSNTQSICVVLLHLHLLQPIWYTYASETISVLPTSSLMCAFLRPMRNSVWSLQILHRHAGTQLRSFEKFSFYLLTSTIAAYSSPCLFANDKCSVRLFYPKRNLSLSEF